MYLALIALLLSPLFLWQSGLPQLSHLFAAVGLGARLVIKPVKFYYVKEWLPLPLFLIYSSIIALPVFALYRDPNTLFAPVYYTFGFLVFILIITIYAEKGELFLRSIFWLHLAVLAVITVSSALGVGRSIIHEGTRMMFTFNNPNQMANWAIWVAVIIAACGRSIYGTWIPGFVALVLASIAVGFTTSRSGFVGIMALIIVYLCIGCYYLAPVAKKLYEKISKKNTWLSLLITLMIVVLLIGIIVSYSLYHEIPGLSLFEPVFQRMINTDLFFELELRSYDRLWRYPQFLFFGAGEGANDRFVNEKIFSMLGVHYEIHSSWAGLLFSYGVVGFTLFILFLYALIKKISCIWFKLLFLGPFLFGFSSYNIRNWYFWVGLAVVYCCSMLLEAKSGKDRYDNLIDLSLVASTLRKKMFRWLSDRATRPEEGKNCRKL